MTFWQLVLPSHLPTMKTEKSGNYQPKNHKDLQKLLKHS